MSDAAKMDSWHLEAYSQANESIRSMCNNLFSLTRISATTNGVGVAALATSVIVKLPVRPAFLTQQDGLYSVAVSVDPIFIFYLGVAIAVFGFVFNLGAALSQGYLRYQIYLIAKIIIAMDAAADISTFTNALDPRYLEVTPTGEKHLKKRFYRGRVYVLTWVFFGLSILLWIFFGLVIGSIGCSDFPTCSGF